MKELVIALILSICTTQALASKLRVGDVIVQPLSCWSCSAIGSENGSEFSHSVIVIQTKPKILFAEALGSARTIDMRLLKMRVLMDGTKNIILRHRELNNLYAKSPAAFSRFKKNIKAKFNNEFKGLPFDHDYLWDNYNESGEEELYCSEFITKILNPYLRSKIAIEPMDFTMNWDFWNTYFGHTPPQNLPGNSPSTFYLSEDFIKIGPL